MQWPGLSHIARCYLGIPATSTSSERSFSLAGRTLEERRSQLDLDTLDNFMFISWTSLITRSRHCDCNHCM